MDKEINDLLDEIFAKVQQYEEQQQEQQRQGNTYLHIDSAEYRKILLL